jgi:hypothetical protein
MTASDDRGKNKIAPATSLGGAPPQTGFADDDAHGPINIMAKPSRQAGIGVDAAERPAISGMLLCWESRMFRPFFRVGSSKPASQRRLVS